jgi:hypothetical protein
VHQFEFDRLRGFGRLVWVASINQRPRREWTVDEMVRDRTDRHTGDEDTLDAIDRARRRRPGPPRWPMVFPSGLIRNSAAMLTVAFSNRLGLPSCDPKPTVMGSSNRRSDTVTAEHGSSSSWACQDSVKRERRPRVKRKDREVFDEAYGSCKRRARGGVPDDGG